MPKNYSNIYEAVYTKGNKMDFGNSMIRGNGIPLDITEVYNSYAAAVEYAAKNPLAYEGQLVSVTENGDTTVYVITPEVQGTYKIDPESNGSGEDVNVYLKEVGSLPETDDNTIELVEGKLRLVGLTDLDNSKTYQPVLVNGKIEWHEPSATTVEGLDTRLTAAEGKVSTLEQTVGTAEEGLVKDVADNKSAIAGVAADVKTLQDNAEAYKAADTALHTTITGEIQTAIDTAVAEVKKYADDNDADTQYDDTEVKEDIQANATAIAGVKTTAEQAAADILAEVEARSAADTALEAALKIYVGEEIGKQAHFSARVVTSEAEMTDPTTLYLMKTAESGEDMYEEWMLISGVATKIGTTATDLTDYAKTADVTTAITKAVGDATTEINAEINALEEAHTGDIQALSGRIDGVESDLDAFETSVATTYETKETVESVRSGLQTSIDDLTTEVNKKADSEEVAASIKAAQDAADAAQADANENAGAIEALQTADEDHESRLIDLESVGAEKNVINGTSSEFTVTESRELQVNEIAKEKITGLTADLDDLRSGKVDVKFTNIDGTNVAWTLLSPENQAKLAALTVGDNGNIQLSGKVNADNVEGLASYITNNRDQIGGLLSSADQTKLSGIASNAQVNVLEGIKVAGAALEVAADKTVNIPFATNNTIGVVLSSDAENKVSVGVDGTMEVNSLNVNKLVQTEGEILILNGGSSIS